MRPAFHQAKSAVGEPEREQADRTRAPDEDRRGGREDRDQDGEGERRRAPCAAGWRGSAAGASRRGASGYDGKLTATGPRSSSSAAKNSRAPEAEDAGEEQRGERLDRGVVGEHRRVVVAARRRDLVLGVGQLRLQLLEVLRRLQVGIRLRDREEPAERLAEQRVRGPGLRPGSSPAPSPRAPSSPPRTRRARAPRSPSRSRRGSGSGRSAASAARRCSTSRCRPRCAAGRPG